MANHFTEEFVTRYRVDAAANPRAFLRLLSECERLKKLMSANSQEIPLNIECFIDDKDVSGKMCRETFEKMASPLLDRVESVMRYILQASSNNLYFNLVAYSVFRVMFAIKFVFKLARVEVI